ncbi:bifunctional enoyl-CoA hydratase/phosphate acetyltransferase [Hyphococcus luteus]|uniref:Enoyl-CoA hydratase n=1 Tax=Hyphococcus luteus TaxID=2058213 RepID=A0A2S7KAT8_9PROT|nr:bifunctional enoyl-CoA hydratase/phosphate acetyltransferase [Marinicaulis flavus]PQA89549.1 enoyl-CoA hydratase [Marinicaulis flavus]
MNSLHYIENRTFDEIKIGESAELQRTLKPEDISLFAVSSGDFNPLHIDPDYARSSQFHEVIAHGMWGGALISALLGTELPGPGAIYLDQALSFRHPIEIGDTVTVRAVVKEKTPENNHVTLDCECVNQDGVTVITGQAILIAPTEKVRRPRASLPEVHLHKHGERFQELIEATRPHDPIKTAVIHPCDSLSLEGALKARDETIMEPVLVGPKAKIEKAAADAGLDIAGLEIVDAAHSHAAAAAAVALAREGRVSALMKGALHTDEVMEAVIDRDAGLRTERRMSHIFAFDVPSYPKLLMITDAAINIYPAIDDKCDIVQNAIDLAQALGVATPKVALLSAVETINPKIASTVDAAALCKMADRGQITGGVLDGPLAFDNAISKSAAATKGIVSPVAGDADILLAPDLEAGNMIAKQLIYLAGADSAGIVLGARVPIMLTSRADDAGARLASAALAQLYVHAKIARP